MDGYRESWQGSIDQQLDKTGGDVVLNLSHAEFIDSRGMGFLLGLHKTLNASGRRLLLVFSSEAVGEAFEAAGISQLLRVFQSEDMAVEEAQKQ
jgi:anti-anti-sigma factor